MPGENTTRLDSLNLGELSTAMFLALLCLVAGNHLMVLQMLVATRPGNNFGSSGNMQRSWRAQQPKSDGLGRKVESSNHCAGNIFHRKISVRDCSAIHALEFAL